MNSILYVGMDVYKENYTLCCYSFDRDKVEYRQTVPSDYRLILKYLEQVHGKYLEEVEFICGYEAGCLGYSLYHQLTDHGVKCIILAPTTMGITNTNRVKTDRKDAANIARCLAFHTYSAVYVPDGEDNAVKEYLRMRDDQKLALKKIKQQITAFVLRLGKQYTGSKSLWTENHLKWLRGLDLTLLEKETLQEYLITYDYLTDKLERLDARLRNWRGMNGMESVYAVWAALSGSNRIRRCHFWWRSETSEDLRKRRTLQDSSALSPARIPAAGAETALPLRKRATAICGGFW